MDLHSDEKTDGCETFNLESDDRWIVFALLEEGSRLQSEVCDGYSSG
jgi:hypothetical protein